MRKFNTTITQQFVGGPKRHLHLSVIGDSLTFAEMYFDSIMIGLSNLSDSYDYVRDKVTETFIHQGEITRSFFANDTTTVETAKFQIEVEKPNMEMAEQILQSIADGCSNEANFFQSPEVTYSWNTFVEPTPENGMDS